MEIEPYSDRWFLDVLRLVESFHKEALRDFDGEFSPKSIIDIIQACEPTNCFLMIVDGHCQGILYGTRVKSPTSGKVIFQEMIWYVDKHYRGAGARLLLEVQKILQSQNVDIIIMAVLENIKTEKIKRFYERLGYRPMETHYAMNL